MKINRVWAMPSHKTFSIKPIRELMSRVLGDNFIDPFPFPFDKDALEYLKTFADNSVDKLAFDPPYSPRQLKEMYGGAGLAYDTKCSYWSELKNEIMRIMKINGVVVSFGWNSMGIGKNRGFKIEEILLVPHGGNHNDTIVTVEKKVTLLFLETSD
jgi:hypothetical protein